jgi:hypothetical protein
MAARLLSLDASRGCVVITCVCGYRSVRVSREAAQGAADRHRAQAHPRQAQLVASQRRTRARNQGA